MASNKSNPFTIYLLKEGFNEENALITSDSLKELNSSQWCNIQNCKIFVEQRPTTEPWWKTYLGITETLSQAQAGGILFINVKYNEIYRTFAITFGTSFHKLEDHAIEYDFGLITTLNAIDPEQIRKTEILEPERAKRQRVQSPSNETLSFFDFDADSDIIKNLSGRVKSQYKELFKSVSGLDSLKIKVKTAPEKLSDLCIQLLDIYTSQDYKENFPNINSIKPIKDPTTIQELERLFIEEYNNVQSNRIIVTVPKLLDNDVYDSLRYKQKGSNRSSEIDYVDIENEMNALEDLKILMPEPTSFDELNDLELQVLNEDGKISSRFPLKKCFIFDCERNGINYHFCDGQWYNVEQDYINLINTTLNRGLIQYSDPTLKLSPYNHSKESEYNTSHDGIDGFICLDQKNISIRRNTPVEPCDLFKIHAGKIKLIHIKRGLRSKDLSHLFNQGYVSLDLLLKEAQARVKLKELTTEVQNSNELIDNRKFEIVYGAIFDGSLPSDIQRLPLFSRISLYRIVNDLESRNIKWNFTYIPIEH